MSNSYCKYLWHTHTYQDVLSGTNIHNWSFGYLESPSHTDHLQTFLHSILTHTNPSRALKSRHVISYINYFAEASLKTPNILCPTHQPVSRY